MHGFKKNGNPNPSFRLRHYQESLSCVSRINARRIKEVRKKNEVKWQITSPPFSFAATNLVDLFDKIGICFHNKLSSFIVNAHLMFPEMTLLCFATRRINSSLIKSVLNDFATWKIINKEREKMWR